MSPMYQLPAESIEAPAEAEFEEKRSRFIGLIARADSEEDARAFIARCVSDYPDARHHCHAFILHVDGAQPVERSSDDGEPSGTAGMPMLDVLRGSGLQNVVAVVVRYFGGIKLGTGGLVRAYGQAVHCAMENVHVVERAERLLLRLELDHATAGKIEAELRYPHGFELTVLDPEYTAQGVAMSLVLDPADEERAQTLIAQLTGGTVEAQRDGTMWVDTPQRK